MCCSCRKAGLDCFTGCGECHSICENMFVVDISEHDMTLEYSKKEESENMCF